MNDLEKITLRDIMKLTEESKSLFYDIIEWKIDKNPKSSELLTKFSEIDSKIRAILDNE